MFFLSDGLSRKTERFDKSVMLAANILRPGKQPLQKIQLRDLQILSRWLASSLMSLLQTQ
jgi:hypothetical protein